MILIAVVTCTLLACTTALYIPTENNVGKNANIAALNEGRKLYINKCSSCHNLFLPDKFNKQEWTHWVDKMADRAKITNTEKEKILGYVTKGE